MSEQPVQRSWPRRALVFLGELALIAVVALVGLEIVGSLRAPDLPSAAPAFSLRAIDGSTVSLADHRGRLVVLNFWATWCTPCRLEMPSLARLAESRPDVTVLGVAIDEDPELVRRTAEELEIPYPVLVADAATRAAYGVTTVPTTVVVEPDGTIRSAHTGLMLDPHLLWATR